MSKAIKRIRKYQEFYELSDRQTLYLVFKHAKINIHIGAKEIIDLVDKDILDEDGRFIENLNTITKITAKEIVAIKPKYESDLSKKVYIHLLKNVCYKNPYTNHPISINPVGIKLNVESKLQRYEQSCISRLKKETAFYNVYNVFLALFPTTVLTESVATSSNTRWVSFFKHTYDGVNLRKKTAENSSRLIKILKTHDAGVFLYATYLYVKSGIRKDQSFIGGQATFFKEWEDWYEQAENTIDDTTTIAKLFKHAKSDKESKFKGGIML